MCTTVLDPGCPLIPLQLRNLGQVGRVLGFLELGVEAPSLRWHKSRTHGGGTLLSVVQGRHSDLYRLEHSHSLSLRARATEECREALRTGPPITMATSG